MKSLKPSILTALLLLFILFPIIFYPPTGDFAIYFKGGEVLFNGGKLYKDFIDVKSPLFFAFSGLLGYISGESYTSIRIVEYFFHFLVSFIIYFKMKKYTTISIAFVSAIVYSISLLVLNFGGTYESETISNLFVILLIFEYIKSQELTGNKLKITYINIGILSAILFSMKLTFFVFPISIFFLNVITYTNRSKLFKQYFFSIIAFILTFSICHIFLLDKEVFQGYLLIFKYLGFYSNIPPLSTELMKTAIKSIGFYFGYFYSSFFSFSALLATFLLFSKNMNTFQVKDSEVSNSSYSNLFQNKSIQNMLVFSSTLIAFLLFSIIFERKFFFYHYSRMLVPLSILSSFGIIFIWENIKYLFAKGWLIQTLSIFIIICFLVIFSPISRIIAQWQLPLKKLQGNTQYFDHIEKISADILSYSDKYKITEYINEHYSDSTKILISANGSFDIYFFLKGKVINSFAQSCFYLSNFRIPKFIEQFKEELNITDLLILQKNDFNYDYNNHQMSSYEAIFSSTDYMNLLNSNFEIVFETKELILLSKINLKI